MIKNKDIPGKPGVYLFKAGEKILYIGKATNLNKRVAQYFTGRDHLIVDNLLEKADDLEFIVTENETDALLLEYNLIHTYRPPFNVRLKDDKSYPFIEITLSDDFPGVYYSRQVKQGNYYAGPITRSSKAKALVDALTRIFKLRVCSEATFRRKVECLYYHIDRCSAPCTGRISHEDYMADVNGALQLLKGKRKAVADRLEKKMKHLAEEMAFEEAEAVKEDIGLLQHFDLDSYISSVKQVDYDVIAIHTSDTDCFIVLFSVVSGAVKGKEFFNFDAISTTPEAVLKDFLLSFYRSGNIPPEIILRFYPDDKEVIEELFSQLAGRKVVLKIPIRGDKRKMSDLAADNLQLYVRKTDYSVIGKRLQEALRLRRFPRWIEGFDISHMSERDRVGAAVAYSSGNPDRRKYRNYIIKKALPGDTEALKEVLTRRFQKAEELPDLLVIDGGKGQLSAALKVKRKLGLSSDIVSIAKEEERIFLEKGGSIVFPEDSPESFLIRNIRDEVHRRAITHHRKRRSKLPE